jgi:hypothetical protein
MELQDVKVIVVSCGFAGTWGRGDTLDEALKNAKKPRNYRVYLAHPETVIRSDGGFNFPHGNPPKEIYFKPAPTKRKQRV